MPTTTSARDRAPVVCAGVLVADHLCSPISRFPRAGEVVKADEMVLNIGGLAANAAMSLARLGIRASVAGRVGDDVFGRFVADTLNARGVETSALRIDPERPTSQSLIINVKGDDRRFIHSFGANAGFSVADLDLALDPPPKVLYLGGYLILPGLDPLLLADRFRTCDGSAARRSWTSPRRDRPIIFLGSRRSCPRPTFFCPTPTRPR